jgi:hypothetical protein
MQEIIEICRQFEQAKTNERKIIPQQHGPKDSELKGLVIVTCETG